MLTEADIRQQTRDLWRMCFGDGEAFLDLFFTEAYRPATNVCLVRDERVVAAAQALPYRLRRGESLVPAVYLAGVSTHPDFRGQGLAGEVIRAAHRLYPDVPHFLVPASEALVAFYEEPRHGGYTLLNSTVVAEAVSESPAEEVRRGTSADFSEIYAFYEKRCEGLFPDYRIFCVALADSLAGGGQVWTARRGGEMVGYCLCRPCGGALVVQDAVPGTSLFASHFGQPLVSRRPLRLMGRGVLNNSIIPVHLMLDE